MGVVSYALCGSGTRALAMLLAWSTRGRFWIAFQLGLDYLFMPLYTGALIIGCWLAVDAYNDDVLIPRNNNADQPSPKATNSTYSDESTLSMSNLLSVRMAKWFIRLQWLTILADASENSCGLRMLLGPEFDGYGAGTATMGATTDALQSWAVASTACAIVKWV